MTKRILLTEDEKKEILKNVYAYNDERYISPEEIQTLREMFNTSDKLKLLRKVLNIFTTQEEGIISPISDIYIGKADANRNAEEYGKAVLINNLADKKIRDSLAFVYQTIKNSIEDETRNEIEKKEKELKEELEKQEKKQEELKEEGRINLGENL